jgi:hypothetical protein
MNNNDPFQDVQKQMRGLLTRLPDVPVASNFTTRVMQAIDMEEMSQSRWRFFGWRWRVVIPRTAAATVIVGLAGFTFYQHEIYVQQVALARGAALVASQQMPSMEALKNFDAIQRMGQTAHPDSELLALASNMQ